MKALTWKPILSNLTEANGELKKLCWRLHFLAFGELPDDCPDHADASRVAWYARREKCCPFAEGSLFVGLEHVYHHLNWSWNCRHTPEERVWHFADNDADRWTKFPDTADFSELWPPDKTVKVDRDDFRLTGSRRKICLFPLRPEIQQAQHKLDNLCRLVEKECFGAGEVATPAGMPEDVWRQPLTEKDLGRRMCLIYYRLNIAWNCRMKTQYPDDERTCRQCRCFSPDFAMGCYNMWR